MSHQEESTSVSETYTDNDHSPFTYQELKRMFLKLVSYEFDIDTCKQAFIQCLTYNTNRTMFPQEALKRTILLSPKSYARDVMCKFKTN
jgi:hypothetical protein